MILTEHWPTTVEEALIVVHGFSYELPVVVLYIRVSSDIQVDEGHSLELQAEHLRQECVNRYPDGCHAIFAADEGLSGTLFWKKAGHRRRDYRPGLTLVRDLVDLGVVRAVGVYRCNRFCRRARIWLEFEEDYLQPRSVLFFSAADGIDTSDPSSKLIFQILMSGAEMEQAQIASGVKDGLRTRREEGYYVGCPSYGWVWQDERLVSEGRRIDIEPVREEADVIRRVVGWYLDGRSPYWIAGELARTGVPAPAGGRSWFKGVVACILRNPTNAGLIRDGRGGLVQGVHHSRRIIEPEVFYRVQERIAARREATRDTNRPQNLIFDGKLVCGLCGARLLVSSLMEQPAHYMCPGKKQSHRHPAFRVRVDLAESRLRKAVLDSAAAHAASGRAAAKLRADLESGEQELRREQRRLSDKLARNRDEICSWAGRGADPDYNAEEVKSALRSLADERKDLEKQLDRVRKDARRQKSRKARCEAAVAVARSLSRLWRAADIEEKRGLVSQLVDSLVCEPTDWGVVVHVDFATGERRDVQFCTRAKAPQNSGNPFAIGLGLLTTAHYLRQGLSIRQIAEARGISAAAVASQVSGLRRIVGAKDLTVVVQALAPVLDARADELYIDGRKPTKTPTRPRVWTPRQIQFVALRTSGLTLPQVAKEMGLSLPGAIGLQMRVYRKLGAHCVADLRKMAGVLGLLG